jgi:hypothetical protein
MKVVNASRYPTEEVRNIVHLLETGLTSGSNYYMYVGDSGYTYRGLYSAKGFISIKGQQKGFTFMIRMEVRTSFQLQDASILGLKLHPYSLS